MLPLREIKTSLTTGEAVTEVVKSSSDKMDDSEDQKTKMRLFINMKRKLRRFYYVVN